MKPEISEILNELYELDSSLKQKEKELVSIISKMIESKPNVKIDNDFKTELKNKILSEIKFENNTYQKSNGFKYLLTFLSAIAVLSLFLNIYPNLFQQDKPDIKISGSNSINLSFAPKIEKLQDDKAFGKLKLDNNSVGDNSELAAKARDAGVAPESISSKKIGGGLQNNNSTTSSNAVINKTNTTSEVKTSQEIISEPAMDQKIGILPYPDYKPKKYIYNLKSGEALPEVPESMYVYKNKIVDMSISDSNISNILKTDIIDFSKLQSLGLSHLSIYENVSNGYQLDISLSEGNVNIYRNYKKWPEIDYSNQKQLSLSDIPTDESIVKVATDFINKYSINLDSYLKPVINNTWIKEYDKVTNKQDYYIPDILSVIYQFNIDGIGVFENYGTPFGLETSVNVRDMKVNSVGPIQKLDLTGSKYDLITGSGEILELAKKGPYYNVFMDVSVRSDSGVSQGSTGVDGSSGVENTTPEVEEIQVEIGNPKLVYLRKYVYNEQIKTTEQFFVPGMMFDILTKSDDKKMIYPGEYITVPLVKDFIDIENNGNGMKVY